MACIGCFVNEMIYVIHGYHQDEPSETTQMIDIRRDNGSHIIINHGRLTHVSGLLDADEIKLLVERAPDFNGPECYDPDTFLAEWMIERLGRGAKIVKNTWEPTRRTRQQIVY